MRLCRGGAAWGGKHAAWAAHNVGEHGHDCAHKSSCLASMRPMLAQCHQPQQAEAKPRTSWPPAARAAACHGAWCTHLLVAAHGCDMQRRVLGCICLSHGELPRLQQSAHQRHVALTRARGCGSVGKSAWASACVQQPKWAAPMPRADVCICDSVHVRALGCPVVSSSTFPRLATDALHGIVRHRC